MPQAQPRCRFRRLQLLLLDYWLALQRFLPTRHDWWEPTTASTMNVDRLDFLSSKYDGRGRKANGILTAVMG